MKLTEALITLNLTKETMTRDNLRQAWRTFAWRHHPDKGGDANVFVQGETARTLVERQLIKQERQGFKCQWCDGTGKQVKQQGFRITSTRCSKCSGTGRLPA